MLTSQQCTEFTFMINTIFYMCIIFLLKLQKVSEDKLSQINERSKVSVLVFNNYKSMGSLNFKNIKASELIASTTAFHRQSELNP